MLKDTTTIEIESDREYVCMYVCRSIKRHLSI